MTLRAVVDTNVLVSGLGWGGPPATVVDAALRGRIQLVTSQMLLDELLRVLAYPRLSSVLRTAGLTATEVVALVDGVSVVVVPIRGAIRARDVDDNRVLEAAVTGSVDVIISGDADLLSLREHNGIPILSASDFGESDAPGNLSEADCGPSADRPIRALEEGWAVVSDPPGQMQML